VIVQFLSSGKVGKTSVQVLRRGALDFRSLHVYICRGLI
jgi:hypothetical protein